ncbi:hypothetical protein ACJMK2_043862, partial [Sinanodonta woodiana]
MDLAMLFDSSCSESLTGFNHVVLIALVVKAFMDLAMLFDSSCSESLTGFNHVVLIALAVKAFMDLAMLFDSSCSESLYGFNHIHRFYRDPKQSGTPSWFVSGCSRDFAEKILTNARQFGMGNTLLRESTTHMSTGSYVITKRVDRAGSCEFDHYEVTRVAEGYKLNVENDHQPMRCLSEVMDYFIQTAGPTTKLLNNNNLQMLGLEAPDYQRMIPRSSQTLENYEEPALKPSQSRTFSAVTYEQESRNYQKSNIGQPVVVSGNKTFSGSSLRNTTTMRELAYRADVAVGLDNLNKVIEGFETPSNEYYNERDLFEKAKREQEERDRAKNSMLPPPSPCSSKDKHPTNLDVPYQPAPPLPRQMDQAVPPPPPPISSLEKLTHSSTTSSTSEPNRKSLLLKSSEILPIQELKSVLKNRAASVTDESIRQDHALPSTLNSQRFQQTNILRKTHGPVQQHNLGQVQSQGQSEEPVESGVETQLPHSFASIRRRFNEPTRVITNQTFRPEI